MMIVTIMEKMMANKMVIMMMAMKMVMDPLPPHLDGVALHLPQLPLLFKSCSRVPQLLAQLLCVRLQPDDDYDDGDGDDDSMVMTMMLVMFVCASNLMFLSSSLTSRTCQNKD